jgi:catechol 2,3-dioxygenase-like lactoylglutathione lyase family enzyme
MIDHLSTYATHFDASIRFYEGVFKALGYAKVVDLISTWDAEWPTRKLAAFGPPHKPAFWVIEVKTPATPRHVAFSAPTRAVVDAFYAAGMEVGGKDNGPPGLRPHYHENYYGAFVVDPDGNNVEAVCDAPPQ